ncbi:hypothetical protein [Massilia soli]|uniref:DUF58 domain-containing protein n=1 Tax=Massilia soli TaxID=2792854 RepID=A0ABS7SR97_9BURK|nr:hypothetical protein [Massilia soli]MBZ2208457.1 hypothetical protein [Massilia soli]
MVEATLWGMSKSEWDLYAVFGTLLSAVASLLAVVVALYLANRSSGHTALVTIHPIIQLNGPKYQTQERFIQITVVNTGERPIRIEQIGWRVGIARKAHAIQTFDQSSSAKLPTELSHGQSARWSIPTDHSSGASWESDIAAKLLHDSGVLGVWSFRAFVYTSVGRTFFARPGSVIKARLTQALRDYRDSIN